MRGIPIRELEKRYPFIVSYFNENKLDVSKYKHLSLCQYLDNFSEEEISDLALDKEKIIADIYVFIKQMVDFLGLSEHGQASSITILPGVDKSGDPENFTEIVIKKAEIISVVGATGSGKSRLLADIEVCAQKDTPTKRTILIDGAAVAEKWRFSSTNKLVAQLSQNMNFIIDMSVKEFLELHAKSRLVQDMDIIVERIYNEANRLSGEAFDIDEQMTRLSGGQSRALMIADTAILSRSPIILIDEIENAGIDRKKALELLLSEDKIVLMSTHDPILALLADKRLVIKNGGIDKIVTTSEKEKLLLKELEKADSMLNGMRRKLRAGDCLDECSIFKQNI